MIIHNYSKCPIRYYYGEEKSLFPEFENYKFVLDFKCSAPDYSGITRGIYDSDTDTLYWQYDFKKFKNNIENLDDISNYTILTTLYNCLHSKSVFNGPDRVVY
jgi:hypothetical protein